MKLKMLITITTIVIALGMYSCRKMDVPESLPVASATTAQLASIKEWVQVQKTISANGSWMEDMITTIDWNKSEKVSFRADEVLITLPVSIEIQNTVNSHYLTKTNSSTRNVIAFILDGEGSVQHGSIVQLTPIQATLEGTTATLVSNIYNKTSTQFTGSFSQFTIDDHFLYELQFKNNRLSGETRLKYLSKNNASTVIVNSKTLDERARKVLTSENETESGTTTQPSTNSYKSNGAIKTNDQDCYYFWLIHYEYNGNEVSTTITYLGSLCGLCDANGIRPGGTILKVKVMCSGGGGGGGASSETDVITTTVTDHGITNESPGDQEPPLSGSFSPDPMFEFYPPILWDYNATVVGNIYYGTNEKVITNVAVADAVFAPAAAVFVDKYNIGGTITRTAISRWHNYTILTPPSSVYIEWRTGMNSTFVSEYMGRTWIRPWTDYHSKIHWL